MCRGVGEGDVGVESKVREVDGLPDEFIFVKDQLELLGHFFKVFLVLLLDR